jgi:anti-anti-sigma regulatory factor
MKEMTVVKTEDGEVTIHLTGEIDASNADGFFAVGEVREYEGGRAIKPIRQF